jgi:hypothetical protein
MTGTLLPVPALRAVDANGTPMSGALLRFYLTGTTTPTPVYTDKTLGTALSNPVVSDSAGLFPPIYTHPTINYRAQLLTGGGSLVQGIDPVEQVFAISAGSITAAMLAPGAAASNLAFTPLNKAGDTASALIINTASSAPFANSAGYIGFPANEQDANYTFAITDQGKMVRCNSGTAVAYTIPANSAVAFVAGTAMVIRNTGTGGTLTIARSSGVTLVIAGSGTSKDVAIAPNGVANLFQEATPNIWVISGVGLS